MHALLLRDHLLQHRSFAIFENDSIYFPSTRASSALDVRSRVGRDVSVGHACDGPKVVIADGPERGIRYRGLGYSFHDLAEKMFEILKSISCR